MKWRGIEHQFQSQGRGSHGKTISAGVCMSYRLCALFKPCYEVFGTHLYGSYAEYLLLFSLYDIPQHDIISTSIAPKPSLSPFLYKTKCKPRPSYIFIIIPSTPQSSHIASCSYLVNKITIRVPIIELVRCRRRQVMLRKKLT